MSVKREGERQLKKHCHPTQSSPAAKQIKLEDLQQESTRESPDKAVCQKTHCVGVCSGEAASKEEQVLKQEDHEEGSGEIAARPLFFFFDTETTGRNIYEDHIIELAAKVIETPPSGSVTEPTFSTLVYTSRGIHSEAAQLTGITSDMLEGKPPFSTVFPEFLQWIIKTKQEVSEHTGIQHFPVLVAHNGFGFDVPLMLAEIERRPDVLTTSDFVRENIRFSDTLHHLRQTKKNGHGDVKDVGRFGLKQLYKHFVPDGPSSGHRALRDVEALEKIFTHSSIASLLSSLPWRTAQEQLENWERQRELRERKNSLRHSLNYKIKDHQAKRLDELKLSYPVLRCIRKVCADDGTFNKVLHRLGVNSIKLRETLTLHMYETVE